MELNVLIVMSLLLLAGACLMILIHRGRTTDTRAVRSDWVKYAVFAAIVLGVVFLARFGRLWLAVPLLGVAIYGSYELARHLPMSAIRQAAVTLAIATLIASLLAPLMFPGAHDWWQRFAFVYLLVALTDSFCQLWGRLLGRHKLCPSLSPGKTWEGFLGGLVTAAIGSQALGFLAPESPSLILALAGALIALSATAGDLLFSAIKRRLGIKDFSTLLPGHGGLLDRFDSLIVAAPCFYWINRLMLQ
ncbi:MAG: phosphatidate cytidylyltransferase [Candidatus Zixiibacteriota bacterium]